MPPQPSRQTMFPLVICYSYGYAVPINLTPCVTQIQTSTSLAGSTRDSAVVALVGSDAAKWVSIGDWVQIDLRDAAGGREHLFFGRVSNIDPAISVAGQGGGAETKTTLTVTTWAEVFERFKKDVRTYFQVRSAYLVTDPGPADIPLLLGVIGAFGKEGFFAPAHVLVQLLLQMLARYGGTLRQTFDLPPSFSPGGAAISLIDIICKMSRCRYNSTTTPLRPMADDTYDDGNYIVDANAINVAIRCDAANPGARTWSRSAWFLSDWARTFAKHPYYPDVNGMLEAALQLSADATVWAAASEYGDLPWCQLHCALVEHVDYKGSAVKMMAQDGTRFDRDFLCSVSFQPIPHPVYGHGAGTFVDEDGNALVQADSTGYQRRPKVFVDARFVSSLPMGRDDTHLHTSWQVTPMDAAFRRMSSYDAAWLGQVSHGSLPIFDVPAISVYGWRPLELQTKYWLDAGGKEFWKVLARKTTMQHAWTIHGPDLLQGSIGFPAFVANVPRPGDVVVVVNEVESSHSGSAHISGWAKAHRKTALDDVFGARPGRAGAALSLYAESVQISMESGAGVWHVSASVGYSHGQPCRLAAPVDLQQRTGGVPYLRCFSAQAEAGGEPMYYLPMSAAIRDIEDALKLPPDPGLAKRIDTAAKATRPATTAKRRKRHGTKARPSLPVAPGVSGMSEEPPDEITENPDPMPETGHKPSRKLPKLLIEEPMTAIDYSEGKTPLRWE